MDEILVPEDIVGKDDKDGAPGSQKGRRMDQGKNLETTEKKVTNKMRLQELGEIRLDKQLLSSS